jgi:hypothetical protein
MPAKNWTDLEQSPTWALKWNGNGMINFAESLSSKVKSARKLPRSRDLSRLPTLDLAAHPAPQLSFANFSDARPETMAVLANPQQVRLVVQVSDLSDGGSSGRWPTQEDHGDVLQPMPIEPVVRRAASE